MNEVYGDLFTMARENNRSDVAICVTTNGMIRNDGRAVMGAGIAKEFRDRIKGIDYVLAKHLKENGNVPAIIGEYQNCKIISFPTKNDWKNPSDIGLIKKSAELVMKLAEDNGINQIYLTRVGCTNGHLDWTITKRL